MNFELIAFSEVHESTLIQQEQNPVYRKATRNMLAADYVCQQVLKNFDRNSKNDLGFILGTRFGELTSTLEFLTAFDEGRPLSPIHFQNSLHNSTLGFICINNQLTGPALTVSCGSNTEKSLMDTAEAIGSFTPFVLLCTVDYIPESLKHNYYVAHPELKKHDGWARAFLVKSSCEHKSFNIDEYIK